MGWTYGWNTRDELVQELTRTRDEEHAKYETIKRAFVGNNLWAVVEVTDKASNKAERHIVLFKLARHGGWGYKDIDESMGPYELDCPLSFFEVAPLPDDDKSYARDWRARVCERHARVNQKLAIGQTVKLTNGHTVRIATLKPLQGHDLADGVLYRIPRRMLESPEPQPMCLREQGQVWKLRGEDSARIACTDCGKPARFGTTADGGAPYFYYCEQCIPNLRVA